MGSHFTNDDLVKDSRLIEDYEIEIAFEGRRDGEEVWEFRGTSDGELLHLDRENGDVVTDDFDETPRSVIGGLSS